MSHDLIISRGMREFYTGKNDTDMSMELLIIIGR
jgi:hypothetical protein